MGAECKQYTGAGWTPEAAAADCESGFPGAPGTFVAGEGCAFGQLLGTCSVVDVDGEGKDYELQSGGGDASKCASAKTGCEVFAKGQFTNGNTCGAQQGGYAGESGSGSASSGGVFVQPYRVCKPAKAGEPPGKTNGEVCTWTLISGCTEEGRHFEDYASCADVLTQRPYWSAPPAGSTAPDDPRLSDAAYMGEVAWAKSQVEASACVCCHTKSLTPKGPSQWFIDGDGIWLDTVSDSGIAMLAGLADSTALGAFAAADNNGFDRTALGMPTTDVERMKALLVGEWQRRGKTEADAAKIPPFGGPLVTQLSYEPQPCAKDEGIAADGTVTWFGGEARYVYVLDAASKSPGVPPNLDMPEGTLWFVQVPTKAKAIGDGIAYGVVSGDLVQHVPEQGAPPALVSGQPYYLYVLRDIGVPITRCLFTAP